MSYALEFDGINDYVSTPSLWLPTDTDDFAVEYRIKYTEASNIVVFDNGRYDSGIYGNLFSGNATFYIKGTSVGTSGLSLNDDAFHKVRLEVVAGQARIYVDDTLEAGPVSVPAPTPSGTFVLGHPTHAPTVAKFEGQLEYLSLEDTNGSNDRLYDARNTSTGSTLPETINSANGTLVNFPTDDSQWIDNGGGTIHDVLLSEAITAVVGKSANFQSEVSRVDTINAVAVIDVQADLSVDQLEGVSISEGYQSSSEILGYISATLSASDSKDAQTDFAANKSESVQVDSVSDSAQAAEVGNSEALSIAAVKDVTVLSGEVNVDIAEVLAMAKVTAAQSDFNSSVSESSGIASSKVVDAAFATSLAEAVLAADLKLIGSTLSASVSEALSAGSDESLLITIEGNLVESLGVSESLLSNAEFDLEAVFNASLSEALISQAVFEAGYSDPVQITTVESAGVTGEGIPFATPTTRTATLKSHTGTVSVTVKARVAVLK